MLKEAFKLFIFILLDFTLVSLLICSPIGKIVIEKYDVHWIGREVSVDLCLINPITGIVWLSGLKVYEGNSDSTFFDAKYVTADFDLVKLMSNNYEVSSLQIDQPTARLIKYENKINFSDMIKRFTPDLRGKSKPPVKFNILNFNITKGEFHYLEDKRPIHFFAKNIDISSKGLRWDNDTVALNYSFLSSSKSGSVVGTTKINVHNLNYLFELKVDNYDLEIVNQYLQDITNKGEFRSQLKAVIKTTGNFQCADSVKASGTLAFKNFHLGKNKKEDLASFKELCISAKLLNPNAFICDFDSITLNKPFLKYELYEELDNLQLMFGEKGSTVKAVIADPKRNNLIIKIVKLVERLARNVLRSDYKLDRLVVNDGNFKFVDYSIDGRFVAAANPFYLYADSIYNKNSRINLVIKTELKPFGKMNLDLSIDPNDSAYFDMTYFLQEVSINMFNPYIVNYSSYKFDSGVIEASGNWKVRDGIINSNNHLILINPGVTKRVKSKQTKWIPVPFLMTLMKQRGNVIDYQIPITGSLSDPNFKTWSIVTDILKNVLMKPVRVIPMNKNKKN